MLVSKVIFLTFKIAILEVKENCPQEGREAARVWLNLQAKGKQHKNVNTVVLSIYMGWNKERWIPSLQMILFFQYNLSKKERLLSSGALNCKRLNQETCLPLS